MISGGIAIPLIRFAIPLFLGSIFQQLYSTTDFLFVGNYLGKASAAAVGSSGILVTCLIGLFTGIATGAGITVSHSVGAGKFQEAEAHMHTAILLALLGGIAMISFGQLAAVSVLELLHVPANLMPEAVEYVRFYFLGMLPMILYNIGAGILRACGDSTSPFYILIIGGFVNVCMDYLMIKVLQTGVRGAAIATTISQSFSAFAVLWKLSCGNEILQLRIAKLKINKNSMLSILQLGIPAGIQSIVITLSNIIVQYHINHYGEDVIAAFATYFKLENFTYFPALAFGQAAMTFVGQNVGAGKHERVKKGLAVSSILSVSMITLIAVFLLALGRTSVGWFIKDPDVINVGLHIIAITFPLYWLNGLIEVFGGGVRGLGHPTTSMIVILCTLCCFRVLLLSVVDHYIQTVQSIVWVYPISWISAAVGLFVALYLYIKKLFIE
ncbi:MAG: MATE family efflux transporter [Eubacteriales bacterium]|nr:MATE family efflux transporter [Eubacteriales bacterium]